MINNTKLYSECQDNSHTNTLANNAPTSSQATNTVTIFKAHPRWDKNSGTYVNVNLVKTLIKHNNDLESTQNFDNSYLHKAVIKEFNDINDLYNIIINIQQDEALIRGGLIDGTNTENCLRRKNAKDNEPATLLEIPLRWLMLDLDIIDFGIYNISDASELTLNQLRKITLDIIHKQYPEFKNVSFIAQFSNGTGFADKKNKIGLHIFFNLSEALTNQQLHTYFTHKNQLQAIRTDTSLFNCAQLHYVANPVCDGFDDHIYQRTVFVKKKNDSIDSNVILDELKHLESKPKFPIAPEIELELTIPTDKFIGPIKPFVGPLPKDQSININIINNFDECQKIDDVISVFAKVKDGMNTALFHGIKKSIQLRPGTDGYKLLKGILQHCPRIGQKRWTQQYVQDEYWRIFNSIKKYNEDNIIFARKNIKRIINTTILDRLLLRSHLDKNQITEIHAQYLSNKFDEIFNKIDNNRVIALDSLMNTGKTTLLKLLIEKYYKYSKVLILTPLINLSKNVEKALSFNDKNVELKGINTIFYQNKDKLADLNQEYAYTLVGVVNSILNFPTNYDLVVIDEVNAVINALGNARLVKDKQNELYARLVDIVRNAGKLIISQDKILAPTVLALLKEAGREKDLHVIHNTYKPEHMTVTFYKHMDVLKHKVHSNHTKGLMQGVISNVVKNQQFGTQILKNELESLTHELESFNESNPNFIGPIKPFIGPIRKHGVGYITGQADICKTEEDAELAEKIIADNDEKIILTLEQTISLILSPAASHGFSIKHLQMLANIGFFDGTKNTNSPLDMQQQMCRVRGINPEIFVQELTNTLPIDYLEVMKAHIINNYNMEAFINSFMEGYNAVTGSLYFKPAKWWEQAKIEEECLLNVLNNNKKLALEVLYELDGYTVVHNENNLQDELKDEQKELNTGAVIERDDAVYTNLRDAKILSEDEFHELKESRDNNKDKDGEVKSAGVRVEEQRALERARICHNAGYNVDDEETRGFDYQMYEFEKKHAPHRKNWERLLVPMPKILSMAVNAKKFNNLTDKQNLAYITDLITQYIAGFIGIQAKVVQPVNMSEFIGPLQEDYIPENKAKVEIGLSDQFFNYAGFANTPGGKWMLSNVDVVKQAVGMDLSKGLKNQHIAAFAQKFGLKTVELRKQVKGKRIRLYKVTNIITNKDGDEIEVLNLEEMGASINNRYNKGRCIHQPNKNAAENPVNVPTLEDIAYEIDKLDLSNEVKFKKLIENANANVALQLNKIKDASGFINICLMVNCLEST